MSVYEVAEALGVPVGTVKARLSRGRTMLATLLNERADEPVEPVAAGDAPAAPAGRPVEPPAPQPRPATEPPRAPDLLSWPGRP